MYIAICMRTDRYRRSNAISDVNWYLYLAIYVRWSNERIVVMLAILVECVV